MKLMTLNPNSYNNLPMDYASDLFINSTMDTISLTTIEDDDHLSYMVLQKAGATTGANCYKDFPVDAGYEYCCTFDSKVKQGQLGIKLWAIPNNTYLLNDADIATGNSWKQQQTSFVTIPASAGTLRVYLVKQSASAMTVNIDNFAVNENVICQVPLKNPDNHIRYPDKTSRIHQVLSSKRIQDVLGTHMNISMDWNSIDDTMLENILNLTKANEICYLDDGNVPNMVETGIVNTSELLNFYGITNPSSTHKAYTTVTASISTAQDDMQDSEFATGGYTAIGTDDSTPLTTTETGAGSGNYIYHKFMLKASIATADIQTLRIQFAGHGNDASPRDDDGLLLMAWDGTTWILLNQTYTSSKTYINWSAENQETARNLVNGDKYIRLLSRTRPTKQANYDLSLSVYYVEAEINEGLDTNVKLSNRIRSVNQVLNKTTYTALIEGSTYKIGSDKRSIETIGQSNGDCVQVDYEHYFEGTIESNPDNWHRVDGETRNVRILFRTLNKI